jgi:hypothetical protein
MNVSFENKFIWWAAPRCASRQTASILGPFKFWQYYPDAPRREGLLFNQFEDPINPNTHNLSPFTHNADIPEGINPNEFDLIINVRNPYSWVVSCWHAEFNDLMSNPDAEAISLEQFLKTRSDYWWTNQEDTTDLQAKKYNIIPKYLIRFENYLDSILSIPFIAEKIDHPVIQSWIDNTKIVSRDLTYRQTYREEYQKKDYRELYNQELADIVWEKKRGYFEFFGYDRDSWK